MNFQRTACHPPPNGGTTRNAANGEGNVCLLWSLHYIEIIISSTSALKRITGSDADSAQGVLRSPRCSVPCRALCS